MTTQTTAAAPPEHIACCGVPVVSVVYFVVKKEAQATSLRNTLHFLNNR